MTGMGARTSAHQKLPVILKIDSPKYAPSMKNEPCARLTTFIRPKMSERPAAIRNSRTPYTSPFRSWATNTSMRASAVQRDARFQSSFLPGSWTSLAVERILVEIPLPLSMT